MKNSYIKYSAVFGLLLATIGQVFAQASFSDTDYNKALWMSTRFYGGQRSTDINKAEQQHNWLIQDYLPDGVNSSKTGISFAQDADNGHDLTGGWFDCGDHVFFGQTGFFAGYGLIKAYDAFPEGFDDYYGEDYDGYRNSGDYSWEGGKGNPNGIPDVLDEVKHQIDFFIKAAKSSTEFYYEKGDGNADHKQRVTSVLMQTNSISDGGEERVMWKNPEGASMASMCGASLAAMSRLYRPFDEAYADLCLVHAEYAYDYAASKSGAVGAASGSFYGPNDRWQNSWATLLAEMYLATGEASYKTTALALSTSDGTLNADVQPNGFYTFDYSNAGELALYALAEIGSTDARDDFYSRVENHFISATNYNNEEIYKSGGGWGKLRYVGNAGFIVALYDKMKGNTTLSDRVYDNIDYILGDNSGDQSFLAGFEPSSLSGISSPTQIHHRNVYLYEGNSNSDVIQFPTKNEQIGALVGGTLTGAYNNVWTDFVNTEVCVDYNVGILGALAAIKEKKDPVDTSKFFSQCSSPNLGADQSLCGLTSITLDANLGPNNIRTYEWFKDGVSQGSANKNNDTRTITEGGIWKLVVDSLGECSRTDEIIIAASLPSIDLGEDVILCSPSNIDLDAGVASSAISYLWEKDGAPLSSETSQTLNVTSEGVYRLTISATGCASETDEIDVTTQLPETEGDFYCPGSNPNAQLQVISSGGPFQWFENETGGSAVFEGDLFEFTPTETTETYYVKDAGSFETNIGPTSTSGEATNWGKKGYSDNFWVEFDLSESFTIESLKLPYSTIDNSHSGVVAVEIRDLNGNLIESFISESKSVTNADAGGFIEFDFVDFNVLASWGTTLRMALNANGTTISGLLNWDKGGSFSFPYTTASGGVSITSANTDGQAGNNYLYFYDWKISSGTDCDRKPVTVELNCAVGTFDNEELELATLFPNPAQNTATLRAHNNNDGFVKIFTLAGQLVDEQTLEEQVTIGENLSSGVYLVEILQDNQLQTIKFIKE